MFLNLPEINYLPARYEGGLEVSFIDCETENGYFCLGEPCRVDKNPNSTLEPGDIGLVTLIRTGPRWGETEQILN